MLSKNSILTGVLAGLIFPLIAWICFDVIYKGLVLMGKPGIPYFIAIALNLLIIRYAVNKEAHKTSQGVMISTFVITLLVFILKLKS